jgi:uncharacterized membrane protein YoaK (UPF0700 family)
MRELLRDARDTVVPPRGGPHGPLPGLLVVLTVVSGLVDAFSYLQLRHVFLANMTGNVVFLSFALGRAPGFVWWASVLAIVAFALGAMTGGRIARATGAHRGRHLCLAASVQAGLVLAAGVVAALPRTPYETRHLVVLISLLGLGMGIQNATVLTLGVPDLTTTVVTRTLTSTFVDSSAGGGEGGRTGRRLVSVVSLFCGGLVGALLTHTGWSRWVLAVAFALLALVVRVTARSRGSAEPWTAAKRS